jgi:predicted nucleic acid-binding protein
MRRVVPIMVDSSVWIDAFNGRSNTQVDLLPELIDSGRVILGDLIVAEVLQGFRNDGDHRRAERDFRAFPVVDLVGRERAESAARKYRMMRKRGITVRKLVDTIIASYCVDEAVPLLFSDRDFRPFVEHFGLIDACT